jgi:hypothetical protein
MKATINFSLLLSFLLLSFTSLFAQATLETAGLKGDVKSVSSTVYRTAMKEGKVKLLSISQLHKQSFNEAGFMYGKEYQVNTLSMGEGPKRTMVFDFDKENKLMKETTSKNGTEERSSQHTYKNGLVVSTKYYKAGGTLLGTQYMTYDDNRSSISAHRPSYIIHSEAGQGAARSVAHRRGAAVPRCRRAAPYRYRRVLPPCAVPPSPSPSTTYYCRAAVRAAEESIAACRSSASYVVVCSIADS